MRRAEPHPSTLRETTAGRVVGCLAQSGAPVWRGIPYAASTAGDNRWRAPRPAVPWAQVRPAVAFADRCAQLTNAFDSSDGVKPGRVVGTEDCLALDIYAPTAAAEGDGLPVMVWIHGGGNVWGRSGKVDGSRLAQNERVIVVAVQYRVGPLGWFAHEALRTEAEGLDAAACFATLDLVASLRWIQDNIDHFGGDPGKVTLFGVSAGGHNVVTLLASPLAKGLFHRAIVQSGAFDSTPLTHAEGTEGDLLNPARKIADKLGAHTADALRAVPVEALWKAYTSTGPGFLDVPRVIEDGVVLPAAPLRDAFRSVDTFHAVPIVLGTNRDEMKLFYLRDERLTQKRFGVFPTARDPEAYDALTGYLSRLWRIRSVDEPAAAMADGGHTRVYNYRFDWDDGGRVLAMDFRRMLGAAHAFDIPFVFNRFVHLGRADRALFTRETEAERQRLSRAMGAYWASFARGGVPQCQGEPAWPTYAEAGGAFLRFDVPSDGGIEVARSSNSLDDFLADLDAELRVDKRFVIDECGRWMFGKPLVERLRTGVARLAATPRPGSSRLLTLPDGRRLCWAEYGDPAGIPVFLFHGNPGSRLAWGAMPGSPFMTGIRIIAPDRPGYGRTDFTPRALELWPDDMAALADHLGIDRFAVFGPSGGSPYALACAWKMPKRLTAVGVFGAVGPNEKDAVVGVIPSIRLLWRVAARFPWAVRAQMRWMARSARRDPVAFAKRLADFELKDEDRPAMDRKEILELFRVDFPEAYRQAGIGSAYDTTIPARWPIPLEEIEAEVHLWHAERDPLVGNMTRYLAGRIPRARLNELPGEGHLWILDHMPDVLDELLGSLPGSERLGDRRTA